MYRVWLWWVARPEFARVECPSCQSQPSLFRAKESPLTHNQTLWDKQICLCLGCWKFYVDINLGLVAVIRCWTDENKYFTSKQTFGADRKTFSGAPPRLSGARCRLHLIKISKESPALGMSLTFRTLRKIQMYVLYHQQKETVWRKKKQSVWWYWFGLGRLLPVFGIASRPFG